MGGSTPIPVWTWSMTEGLRRDGMPAEPETTDPRRALDFVIAHADAAIFQFKDFHEALRDSAEARRRLRDAYESCVDTRKFVVITSPVRLVSEDLERVVLFMELRPPDQVELVAFLLEVEPVELADSPKTERKIRWCLPEEARARIRRKPMRRLIDLAIRRLPS